MTLSTTINRVSYDGDDSTTEFPFVFKFLNKSAIKVVLRDANGVETTLTITTHYTLTDPGDSGTVTMLTAPATGETLVIYREVALTQTYDPVEGGSFPVDAAEDAWDKAMMAIQQLEEAVGRSIQLPISSQYSDLEIPDPEATKLIRWNPAANALENVNVENLGAITTTDFIRTLLDDADKEAARTTIGFNEYFVDADETDQGAVGNGRSINALVDLIGTSKVAVIKLTHSGAGNTTTYTLTTSEEIPTNIFLEINPGAILDGAGTLTLPGGPQQVKCGTVQKIYGPSLTVSYGKIGLLYPEWFGVVPDDTGSTYEDEMAKCISAAMAGSAIKFQSALYYFDILSGDNGNACIRIDKSLTLEGNRGTVLKKANSLSARLVHINNETYYNTTMNGLTAYNIADPTSGGLTVTCSTVSEAGNFSAGEHVVISSRTGPTADETPFVYEFNEVVSADGGTGIITLKNPVRLWNDSALDYEISNIDGMLVEDVKIRNLKFDGNSAGNQNVYALWAKNIVIENCKSYNAGTGGIVVQNCWEGRVQGNKTNDNVHVGASGGIATSGCNDLQILYNASEDNDVNSGYGIFIDEGGGWLTIIGNKLYGNKKQGLYSNALYMSIIKDNMIMGNGDEASNFNFSMSSGYRNIVKNNQVFDPQHASARNIAIYYESEKCPSTWQNAYHIISNNKTSGGNSGLNLNHYFARSTTAVHHCLVAHNICEDGIDAQYAENTELDRNHATLSVGNNKGLVQNGFIQRDSVNLSTSGTDEYDLASVIIPQNFHNRYSSLRVVAAGVKNNSGGTKTLNFYIGAAYITFHLANNDTEDWSFIANVHLRDAAVQYITWQGGRITSYVNANYELWTEDLSAGNLTMKITGECADAGDSITQRVWIVEAF